MQLNAFIRCRNDDFYVYFCAFASFAVIIVLPLCDFVSFVVDLLSGRGFYLVAPAVLGVIHGHVGAFQKLIEFPVSLFHYRDAEAGGNP